MTDFKKGNRVWHSRSRRTGVIVDGMVVHGVVFHQVSFNGSRTWLAASGLDHLDPAPLRFSDVRTGDKITVLGGEYEITGIARKRASGGVSIFGFAAFHPIADQYGTTWVDGSGFPATLTSHTPAPAKPVEPEWHRARVIKATIGTYPETEILLHNYSDGWTSRGGGTYKSAALTNVKIIVDEHGQVRA